MVEKDTKINVELMCGDIFNIVASIIRECHSLIKRGSPEYVIIPKVELAERLNNILVDADYDRWSKRTFDEIREDCKL